MKLLTERTLIENAAPRKTSCKRWHTWAWVGLLAVGCHPPRTVPHSSAGRSVYDTTPIDVSTFGSNLSVRRRILYMPFGEAASRLGSLRYEAHSTFTVSHGSEELAQSDAYVVVQDSSGNFHVTLTTPLSELETYQVGEAIFVRYDKGTMRQKTRRDMDAGALADTAIAVAAQALEQFPGAVFSDGRSDKQQGRSATTYRVRLLPGQKNADLNVPTPPLRWHIPTQPPPRWREQAKALDLSGWISLDNATGVVLAADIEGRLEVPTHAAQAAQVAMHVTVSADPGHAATVKAPRGLAEFRRIYRQRDPLSFFRDQVPIAKPEESKPN